MGSSAIWITDGSPPESTASRASSITGSGGHHTMSSASWRRRRCLFSFTGVGDEKGTRKRRQERSLQASDAGTLPASCADPRRARRWAAVVRGEEEEEEEAALRERKDEILGKGAREWGEEAARVKEKEKAKEMEKASLTGMEEPPVISSPTGKRSAKRVRIGFFTAPLTSPDRLGSPRIELHLLNSHY